jgi:hypothetical protein
MIELLVQELAKEVTVLREKLEGAFDLFDMLEDRIRLFEEKDKAFVEYVDTIEESVTELERKLERFEHARE